MGRNIRGLIFDKDGTLYDFNGSWGPWAAALIADWTGGDATRSADLARKLDFDLEAQRFRPGSIAIAHTADEIAQALLGDTEVTELVREMNARAEEAPQVAAADLPGLLHQLRRSGRKTAVVTNDGEAPARAHLGRSGVTDLFEVIIGYDSGHGAKPDPGPVLAAARAMGLAPRDCVMIGDSTHDLIAGRAAGTMTLGVLTGPAGADELSPHADAVLPSIADLPDWLER